MTWMIWEYPILRTPHDPWRLRRRPLHCPWRKIRFFGTRQRHTLTVLAFNHDWVCLTLTLRKPTHLRIRCLFVSVGSKGFVFSVGSQVFNLFRQTQMLKEQGELQTAGLHSGCCKRTSTSMTMAYSNLRLCHKLGHAQSSKHYAWRTRKAEAVWTCALLWIKVLTSIRQARKYVWTHKIDL